MRSLTSTLDRCDIMVRNSVFREKLIEISLRFMLRSHCVRYCQLVNPFFNEKVYNIPDWQKRSW